MPPPSSLPPHFHHHHHPAHDILFGACCVTWNNKNNLPPIKDVREKQREAPSRKFKMDRNKGQRREERGIHKSFNKIYKMIVMWAIQFVSPTAPVVRDFFKAPASPPRSNRRRFLQEMAKFFRVQ